MTERTTLVVAQAPGVPGSRRGRPLEFSGSLTRLAKYAAVQPSDRVYELMDFVNLVSEFPGRAQDGKHHVFPVLKAVQRATQLAPFITDYHRVILLGSGVREAFSRAGVIPSNLGWFETYELWDERESRVTYLSCSPHPSGASMFWNDPVARAAGEAFWRAIVKEAS